MAGRFSPAGSRPPFVLSLTLLLGLAIGASGRLEGQEAVATLEGVVTESGSQIPIVGATVLLRGTVLSATTSGRGAYRLTGISPGHYEVRVIAIGYTAAPDVGVDLRAGEPNHQNFQLQRAIVELPGVVVTASQKEERIGDMPASVAVVTRDEVVERNAVTLDEALPFVPGVIFNNGAIDIRGASGIANGVGSRVLVLLDGHPVLSADGAEVNFDALPLLDIQQVEVVKGAYSVLYGSNAFGGVVNVITSPIGPVPETTGKAYFGAYDTPTQYRFTPNDLTYWGLEVQHSQQIGRVGARVFAAHETNDGYRQNGELSRWLFRTKLTVPAGSRRPSELYAVFSRANEGSNFQWRSGTEQLEVDTTHAEVGDYEASSKLSMGARVYPLAGQRVRMQVTPYFEHNWVQNHFHKSADSIDHHIASRLGTGVQVSATLFSRMSLTAGGEGSYTFVHSNFLGAPRLQNYALYAQSDVELGPRVVGSAGARVDYHQATGGGDELALSPKLGFVFKASDRFSSRISLARGYRSASAIEQFVSTNHDGFPVVPNPDLHGETAWSGEIGSTASAARRLWLDGAAFWAEYDNLIAPAAAPAPYAFGTFQFRNVQRARVRGVDLGARIGFFQDILTGELTYTFIDSRDLDTGLRLPYRSRHNLTGTLSAFRGLLGLDVRYRSRVDQVLLYSSDPRTAITLVDLRLGHSLFGTTFRAKLSNLFQADYVDVMERTHGPTRSLLISASRTF